MFDCILNTSSELSYKQLLWRGTDIPKKNQQSTWKINKKSKGYWIIQIGNCRAMHKNVQCLYYHEVEAMEYLELLCITYGDMNAATQRV